MGKVINTDKIINGFSLRELYQETIKASKQYMKLKMQLDKEIIDIFGIHYSDYDEDRLIDCIDYGMGGISYDKFIEIMNELELEGKDKIDE